MTSDNEKSKREIEELLEKVDKLTKENRDLKDKVNAGKLKEVELRANLEKNEQKNVCSGK